MSAPAHQNEFTLRLIGGQWRGSKLHFPKLSAIRPTPDRVRETLFNWLQHDIVGARCLDLYAGSGALGLEALSRGAAHSSFVDTEAAIVNYLRATLTRLNCTSASTVAMDALSFLGSTSAAFDLVFIDPPFAATQDGALFASLFALLQRPGLLNPQAQVYLECPTALGAPDQWPHWPASWRLRRSKQAGQVGYHLLRIG